MSTFPITPTTLQPGMPTPTRVSLTKLGLKELQKSPGNKRASNQPRAIRIAAKWDEFMAGAIHVSHRDNHYYVIDGWHRVMAARHLGHPSISAIVIEGYSEADEARGFLILNYERIRPGSGPQFWAAIDAQEPLAITALQVATLCDVRILEHDHPTLNPGETRAYSALRFIMTEFGPDTLQDTLTVLRTAWPTDPRALGAEIMRSVADFIYLYDQHPDYKLRQLTTALTRTTVHDVLRQVRGLQGASTQSSGAGTWHRMVLLNTYNWKLQSHRLPETSSGERAKRFRLRQNIWGPGDGALRP